MNLDNLFANKKSTLLIQIIIGVVVALLSFFLFERLINTIFEKEKLIFDSYIVKYIYSFRNSTNTKFMFFISNFGFYGIIFLSFLVTSFLIIKKHINLSIYFLFIVCSGFIANALLKLLIQRPRPTYLPLYSEVDFSFPSGHTMEAFIFFITLTYLYYHLTKKKYLSLLFLILFLVITVFIGISRIYLGVHYPSDILGGFIAGFLWFVWVITANKICILIKIIKK